MQVFIFRHYAWSHICLKLKIVPRTDVSICCRARVYSPNKRFYRNTIWAPSSEFVSSSIPSWQTLTVHAQPFRGARDLAFCQKVPLDSLLVWASSEGSGETARMRRLARTFAARLGDKYQIRLTRSNFNGGIKPADVFYAVPFSTNHIWCLKFQMNIYLSCIKLMDRRWLKEINMTKSGIRPTLSFLYNWALTWQNQQNECAPSEDSDQPGHPPSLIRVFAVRLMGS